MIYWPVDESLFSGRTRARGLNEVFWAMEGEIRKKKKRRWRENNVEKSAIVKQGIDGKLLDL